MTTKVPAGYALERTRVTWTRWDADALRNRVSHPTLAVLTEPDGNSRTFDTMAAARAWLADPDNVAPEE
jgi:hypothetical protein